MAGELVCPECGHGEWMHDVDGWCLACGRDGVACAAEVAELGAA